MTANLFFNPHVHAASRAPVSRAALEFHRRLPGYAPTPLLDAPTPATSLGVGKLWVKDESCRMGLPAFKILGASWAVYQALQRHMGSAFAPWDTLDDLRAQITPLLPLTLAAATDGNHGRAVARMAAWLGSSSHIFVPAGMAQARIDALKNEGATVTIVDGSYDDAVAYSAQVEGPRCLVISDTSWPGYEDVPRQVIEGYSTILWEVDDALAQRGEPGPDVVLVQIGVGALASAVVQHYRRGDSAATPAIIGVEPTTAACALASMLAGQIVEVPGPHNSIMVGLNCGTPSLIAWPAVSTGIDLFIAVEDERARQAMRHLAAEGITAGETGAAGVAGLTDLLQGPHAAAVRDALGIAANTRVLALVTEGATDPVAYAQIVGRAAEGCGVRKTCPLCRA
jgi:diaminopropionate ammonia-lyase